MDFLLSYLSSHSLELVTVFVSLLWLYLEYKASIWLWPVGIILPILWIPIAWKAHLYGMLSINIYYLITSIWGWIAWLRRGSQAGEEEVPITDIPRKTLLYTLLITFALYYPLIRLSVYLPEWRIPWADALLTLSSVIGMIWMARKWRQHWLCWIVANAAGVISLLSAQDYLSTFVYAVNFVTAFFGFYKWTRLMKRDQA
ncbi:nicotinamide mononucleotide transporter PnuC [Porphyromonas catoniae F0037]|jgi:nicotinamide mononucleotide transporter pnuC|uniref:Nicotinamide riboside transporter PnuC n=1 Tax=Porphyromonas catoniae F0037 TaxID=1127696 RepID=L1NFP9_9PORP|nr:nicotinamide riboside transporter PnuC [Porphyromonas catoniae]EKY02294.1 nicotinamide mononucleotide transporter PnuC [Porphyromonas catoniae F0037]